MTVKYRKAWLGLIVGIVCLFAPIHTMAEDPAGAGAVTATAADSPADAEAAPKRTISNKRCMRCHGDEEERTATRPDGTLVNIFVPEDNFAKSVHGKQLCVGCHNNVTELPHQEPLPKSVGCVQCHMETWAAQKDVQSPQFQRLGVVLKQIESYMHSVHAQPSLKDQSKLNATCFDCHEAHNIGAIGSQARAEHRLKNPEVCGRCHEKEKAEYMTSVHGQEVLEKHNSQAAVCSDCHSTHNIDSPKRDEMKLLITRNCGNCHKEEEKSYMAAYHGQVNKLGYTHTAKCFDCHGGHGIKKAEDPASSVYKSNRLDTCRKCHKDAPPGFLGFHAHGNTHDLDRYPGMWITARLMDLLIIGVFLFFWTHMLLWFYRERKDIKEGKGFLKDPPARRQGESHIYIRRFSKGWRVVHFLLAVAIMTLVLTGTAVLFGHTEWAQNIINLLGGPKVAAIIHRTAAVTFAVIFFGHLIWVAHNIRRSREKFDWFGPVSLVPNLKDLSDIVAVFKWFFGKGPKPEFDRWTYWEKFDYWAPFWGMFVIGVSGLMLWFPTATATLLPGSVFNIATILHAEEAILATVFLFTVHFFNAHFRPHKFPMDIVIFTGAVNLKEFKHEHRLEYERLEASGELEKYLIKGPNRRQTKYANWISATLIIIGLALVAMVIYGYVTLLMQ